MRAYRFKAPGHVFLLSLIWVGRPIIINQCWRLIVFSQNHYKELVISIELN